MNKHREQELAVTGENVVAPSCPFPPDLVLTPLSRRPIKLPDETVQVVMEQPIPVTRTADCAQSARSDGLQVSIVIVTFNNLVFTRFCLESLLVNTEYSNYEVIVIDNNSTDGTTGYLQELSRYHSHVRVVLNDANRGFAPANNQGLALAHGDVLVLLNNDTIVPSGWLTRLVGHLEDSSIGLVGPVTNRIGNEAEIDADYRTYGEFVQFAQEYTKRREGQIFPIRTLCMYCLAMRRDFYQQVGPLDERFEVGMLEDDDYSLRAHEANYRVVCAEGVFVHHFGQASFGSLVPTGEYAGLLEANRRRFEEKWGVPWEPYGRRLSQHYLQLPDRLRECVRDATPPDATVLVVSKGDDELLKLCERRAWHFPQSETGEYAGCYPIDSVEAIQHLESLRAKGGQYLLFPSTTFWWLDHYEDFCQYLDTQYQRIWHDKHCIIYKLLKHG